MPRIHSIVSWVLPLALVAAELPLRADIQLVTTATIEGSAADQSNFGDRLSTGQPHNQLGGFSAIDYLGGDRYLVLSDRGPGDGAARFRCRWHILEIPVKPDSRCPKQLGTTCLSNSQGQPFTGFSAAIHETSQEGNRFDPEGLRVFGDKVLVSEEYGPMLLEFSFEGRQIGQLPLPGSFFLQTPSPSPVEENSQNQIGRQANRGPEGLAITPSGRTLVAAMQGPLLQDAKRLADGKLQGKFTRLVVIDLATRATREFVYPLEDFTTGISEILAINEHEFLVLERDGKAKLHAKFKRITRIDIASATDVIGVDALPHDVLPGGIQPVQKANFLDFLDPPFGLVGKQCPEKLEGLAFGPLLEDGRFTLAVTIDNDFKSDQPNQLLFFAITPGELPGFGWKR